MSAGALFFSFLETGNFKPEAGKSSKSGGLPEYAQFFNIEAGEDLRADAVAFAVPFVGLVCAFGQGAVEQGGAVFGAVQKDDYAAFGLLDALECFGQRP